MLIKRCGVVLSEPHGGGAIFYWGLGASKGIVVLKSTFQCILRILLFQKKNFTARNIML